ERWATGVPSNQVLCDVRDHKPILPVTLRGHDDRILSHMDLCWIDVSEVKSEGRSSTTEESANVRQLGSG
ncbi:MAG TPA: hypothetical protein PKC46_04785, partial [Sphingorhabdus sp.]|nr:hypothetical protein [Sphingorhabdus sp.]